MNINFNKGALRNKRTQFKKNLKTAALKNMETLCYLNFYIQTTKKMTVNEIFK